MKLRLKYTTILLLLLFAMPLCSAYSLFGYDLGILNNIDPPDPPFLKSAVTRNFSDNTPDQCSELTVSLTIGVIGTDTYYAIDEQVPSGWIISDPGTGYIPEPGRIKWIVIMDAVDTVYQYKVMVPCHALGIYSFGGIYMFEGDIEEQTILGETDVDVQEVECITDDDCNDLDNDNYCDSDLIKHDEGRCVDYECTTETTLVEDCNDLDNDYCDNTLIKHEDYTCEAASCVLDSTTTVENCYDGLWCNGQETCENAQCVNGIPVDCSQFDLSQIETCGNDPDNNPLTWDYREAFTSECTEGTKGWSCTTDVGTVTSECSVGSCEAECDAANQCPDTGCDNLDDCYGGTYRDYDNVQNACLGDCICEQNECSEYLEIITDNDGDSYDIECDNDCDDSNPDINPGATEICDNDVDEDCDGYLNNGCECEAEETGRECVSDGYADVTYEWNYAYCGESYTDTVEDQTCLCDYTEWTDDECISEGYMQQVRYETTEFGYCDDQQYQEIEDVVCNCDYSEWQDDECIADGIIKQIRTETSGHDYCDEILTRETENPVCSCISTETSRECVANVTALVNYSWNYPYCEPDSEYVYDQSCLICIPSWICTEYSECTQENYQYCTQVQDTHNCEEYYTGDYSEFIKECNYCSIHGPTIITDDTITVIEGELVTLDIEMTDPDSTQLTYSISAPVGNDKKWQTQEGDEGEYNVLITVSDGICTTTKTVKIIVKEESHQSLIIKRTNYNEFIKPGQAQELYVTLENTGNTNFEDLKITAFIDTLGIWKKTRQFDLKKGETTRLIEFDIPYYASKGRHYIRIVVSNDHIRRVIYRDFDVV